MTALHCKPNQIQSLTDHGWRELDRQDRGGAAYLAAR